MPTHKELPGWYLDGRPRPRGPRRAPSGLLLGALVGLAAGLVVADVVALSGRSGPHPGAPPRGASTALNASRGRPGSVTGASARPPRSQTTSHDSLPGRTTVLARGTSQPGTGRSPQLVVEAAAARVTVRSLSLAPVAVSMSAVHGRAPHAWTTLGRGASVVQMTIPGRRYGYCFAEPSAPGFAATRGCGTLVVHEYLNGARLRDAGPIAITFVRPG